MGWEEKDNVLTMIRSPKNKKMDAKKPRIQARRKQRFPLLQTPKSFANISSQERPLFEFLGLLWEAIGLNLGLWKKHLVWTLRRCFRRSLDLNPTFYDRSTEKIAWRSAFATDSSPLRTKCYYTWSANQDWEVSVFCATTHDTMIPRQDPEETVIFERRGLKYIFERVLGLFVSKIYLNQVPNLLYIW